MLGSNGIEGKFMPSWRLGQDTNLATVIERQEWATFVLPPKVRAGFSKNSDKEIESWSNATILEVNP